MLRRIVVLVVSVAAALAAWPGAAAGHGSASLTIHSDGLGSVWVTATWTDGHPIAVPMAAALSATSRAGTRIGPAPLRSAHDGAGTLTFDQRLTPGEWAIVADLASPAIGHCEASIQVADRGSAPPGASQIRCAPSDQPVNDDARETTMSTSKGSGWPVALAVGLGLLVAAGAGLAIIRRRRALP